MRTKDGDARLAGVTFFRDPKLPQFELKRCDDIHLSYKKHFHEEYSVGVVEQGFSRVWCDGVHMDSPQGRFISMPPLMPHACNPSEKEPWSYWMLFIRPDWLRLAEAAGEETFSWVKEPFLADPESSLNLQGLFRQALNGCIGGSSPLETESAVMSFMNELGRKTAVRSKKRSAAAEYGGGRMLQLAREYLHDRQLEKVTLEELESATGMNRFHLVHAFTKVYRLPPHSYQNLLRINYAKKALMDGRSIADVALEAGFCDQSHFTRRFREYVGVTPRRYLDSL